MSGARQLSLTLAPREISRFSGLLQRGVSIRARVGCSIWTFLTDQLRIAPAYVKERVATVFLDGQVVDSLDDAIIRDGSLLTLSAALPGLVGATLRRGGPYSALRAEITRAAESLPSPHAAPEVGVVRVKLFNLLIEELGPVLLAQGIVLEHREAKDALGDRGGAIDDVPAGEPVALRVHFTPVRHEHSPA